MSLFITSVVLEVGEEVGMLETGLLSPTSLAHSDQKQLWICKEATYNLYWGQVGARCVWWVTGVFLYFLMSGCTMAPGQVLLKVNLDEISCTY